MTVTGSGADRDRLVGLAKSADWQERSTAGRLLASFAGDSVVDDALAQLLLDTENTFVARETAEALLARRDALGMRLFAAAFALAEDNTGDWLATSLYSVMQSSEDVEALRGLARSLLGHDDDDVRRGARELLDWLGSV